MNQQTKVTRESLAEEAKKIIDFANINLEQLEGKGLKRNTTQDYFLGILRRQAIILHDLVNLLTNSHHNNYTSLFILCRCLTDDFLYAIYLKTHDEEDENIIRITANAHAKSFQSLEKLTESNTRHFKGKYPFYLTAEELIKLKGIFISKEENAKFLKTTEPVQFKAFLQLTQLVDKIDSFELSAITLRAFFLWKTFSEFVHYSTQTFELESDTSDDQTNLFYIEEVLLYSVNTIELAFRYFAKTHGFTLKIDKDWEDGYLIKYTS